MTGALSWTELTAEATENRRIANMEYRYARKLAKADYLLPEKRAAYIATARERARAANKRARRYEQQAAS